MSFYEVMEMANDLCPGLDRGTTRHPPSISQVRFRTRLDWEPHPCSPSLRRALPPAPAPCCWGDTVPSLASCMRMFEGLQSRFSEKKGSVKAANTRYLNASKIQNMGRRDEGAVENQTQNYYVTLQSLVWAQTGGLGGRYEQLHGLPCSQHCSQWPTCGSNPCPAPGDGQAHVVFLHNLKQEGHLAQAATRMGLRDVTLRGTSPSQKDECCAIPPTWGPWESHVQRHRREEVGARGWRRAGSA